MMSNRVIPDNAGEEVAKMAIALRLAELAVERDPKLAEPKKLAEYYLKILTSLTEFEKASVPTVTKKDNTARPDIPSALNLAFRFPVGTKVIKTVDINQRLYPSQDLPYCMRINLEATNPLVGVGILTDWWQKRPKKIQVFELQKQQRVKLLGCEEFPDYLNAICGQEFDSKCEHPDRDGSSKAELKVPFDAIVMAREIEIELDGLLNEPNEFVLFFGVRVFGR